MLSEVPLCHLSLYRHEKSVQQLQHKDAKGGNPSKGSYSNRHILPLVQPHPFVCSEWRRERSVADYYDFHGNKRKSEQQTVSPRLLLELEADARDSRSQTAPDTSRRCCSQHPKAEFPMIIDRRSHDVIPSFIPRFERSKTTTGAPQKDLPSDSETYVSGGCMNRKINKQHLHYLNPMKTYHHSGAVSLPAASSDTSSSSRHTGSSFLLKTWPNPTSTYGHIPYIHEKKTPSAQTNLPKFNEKLGAAKNALEILSQCGTPTDVELSLKRELAMNLERFRKDRGLLHSSLVASSPRHAVSCKRVTPGEMALLHAQKENKAKKNVQKNALALNELSSDLKITSSKLNSELSVKSKTGNAISGLENIPENPEIELQETIDEDTSNTVLENVADIPEKFPVLKEIEENESTESEKGENDNLEYAENVQSDEGSRVKSLQSGERNEVESLKSGEGDEEVPKTKFNKVRSLSAKLVSRQVVDREQVEFADRYTSGTALDDPSDKLPGTLTARSKTTTEYLDNIRANRKLSPTKKVSNSEISDTETQNTTVFITAQNTGLEAVPAC